MNPNHTTNFLPKLSGAAAFALCLLLLSLPLCAAEEGDDLVRLSPDLAVPGDSLDATAFVTSSATGCYSQFTCGDGNVISCSGQTSCEVYPWAPPRFVRCDGVKTYCPNMCKAESSCPNGGVIRCWSDVGNCQSGFEEVTCDYTVRKCRNIGPGF